MREIGSKIIKMGLARFIMHMEINMKATGYKIKSKEKENSIILMELCMRANFSTIAFKELVK